MDRIDYWAKQSNLNPDIVRAVVSVESGGDTYAVRYEPNWKWWLDLDGWAALVNVTKATEQICQSMSWGLMQIMGAVARELGMKDDLSRLCDPEYGLKYGCMKLRQNLDKFGTIERALAAYNAGSPASKTGQAYAAKVLSKIKSSSIA
jgi:soluble lytic murein transglycosylase-like protein